MKKSQILAAIALAFALGVVAPVATISNASAISFADAAIEGSKNLASGTEVANAIAAVKANKDYQKAMIVIDAYNTYNANSSKYVEYSTVENGAGSAVWYGVKYFNMTAPIAGIEVSQAKATIAETEEVIAAVKSSDGYKVYDDLANALESKDKTSLIAAVKAYNAADFTTVKLKIAAIENDDDTALDVDSAVNNIKGTAALEGYNKFNDRADAIEEAIAKYEAGYEVLSPAFAANLLSADGAKAYKHTTVYDEDTDTYSLSGLAGAIYASGSYVEENFISTLNLNKWNTVNAELESITSYDTNEDTEGNWGIIHNLAVDYRAATGSNKLVGAIMTELAGATTEDPSVPDDTDYSKPRRIVSVDGKVSITGIFPKGVYVEVSPATMPENFAGFGVLNNVAYEIVIKNEDGSIYEVKQTVAVSIAVPQGINGANSDVMYVTPMGGTENMNAKYVEADGAMTFTTNHFSIYAIVERAAGDNGGNTETPGNTGTIAQAEGTASATGILAGIAAALTAAGAGVVAFRNARRNSKKNA